MEGMYVLPRIADLQYRLVVADNFITAFASASFIARQFEIEGATQPEIAQRVSCPAENRP
jgi:hypothetical protein